jgi:hypothetical protein
MVPRIAMWTCGAFAHVENDSTNHAATLRQHRHQAVATTTGGDQHGPKRSTLRRA